MYACVLGVGVGVGVGVRACMLCVYVHVILCACLLCAPVVDAVCVRMHIWLGVHRVVPKACAGVCVSMLARLYVDMPVTVRSSTRPTYVCSRGRIRFVACACVRCMRINLIQERVLASRIRMVQRAAAAKQQPCGLNAAKKNKVQQ